MDINRIIRRIKRDIGIYGIALPIENLDEEIMQIIEDTTLPVFSLYNPLTEIRPIDVTMLKRGTERADGCELFIIPPEMIENRKLLYIKRVSYDETYMRANYYPNTIGFNSIDGLGDLLVANIGKNTIDQTVNSLTFHFEHPNKLYIYDALITSRLRMVACFEHDKSFASIPPTAEESFFKLAVLDVEAGLYQTVKHYNKLETPLGVIELNIDDWASAKEKRDELVKEWDEIWALDSVDLDYY